MFPEKRQGMVELVCERCDERSNTYISNVFQNAIFMNSPKKNLNYCRRFRETLQQSLVVLDTRAVRKL
jgi:hypothetical protein